MRADDLWRPSRGTYNAAGSAAAFKPRGTDYCRDQGSGTDIFPRAARGGSGARQHTEERRGEGVMQGIPQFQVKHAE